MAIICAAAWDFWRARASETTWRQCRHVQSSRINDWHNSTECNNAENEWLGPPDEANKDPSGRALGLLAWSSYLIYLCSHTSINAPSGWSALPRRISWERQYFMDLGLNWHSHCKFRTPTQVLTTVPELPNVGDWTGFSAEIRWPPRKRSRSMKSERIHFLPSPHLDINGIHSHIGCNHASAMVAHINSNCFLCFPVFGWDMAVLFSRGIDAMLTGARKV